MCVNWQCRRRLEVGLGWALRAQFQGGPGWQNRKVTVMGEPVPTPCYRPPARGGGPATDDSYGLERRLPWLRVWDEDLKGFSQGCAQDFWEEERWSPPLRPQKIGLRRYPGSISLQIKQRMGRQCLKAHDLELHRPRSPCWPQFLHQSRRNNTSDSLQDCDDG